MCSIDLQINDIAQGLRSDPTVDRGEWREKMKEKKKTDVRKA